MVREQGFVQVFMRIFKAYVRMSCTVVIAVVIRLFLDCIGITLTGQDPTAVIFWFAHCDKEGKCIWAALVLFLASLFICSFFAWSSHSWITDPTRNSYARRYSFGILMDALAWVPISVGIGKTNALVEWFMDISEVDLLQALLSSAVAAGLTLTCALLSHLAMKHCDGVARASQVKEAGWRGYGKFFLLSTLYCLGWAVGWSNWELVLALMDAMEPGESVHNTVLAVAVMSFFVVVTGCFYSKYGPEPVIPDPEVQQLCYGHGYSSSLWRSLVSYLVYSCVVFNVMLCCDANYGLLHILADQVYPSAFSAKAAFDAKALVVIFGMSLVVMLIVVLVSSFITKWTSVDELSSMRLSRSVDDARQLMFSRRLSLSRTSSSTSLDGDKELQETGSSLTSTIRSQAEDTGDGDDAAGPTRTSSQSQNFPLSILSHASTRTPVDTPYSPVSSDTDYSRLDADMTDFPGRMSTISRTVCASILVYDVLGLVVCFEWGAFVIRLYSTLFGHLAGRHVVLYFLTTLVYAIGVTAALLRFVFVCFPSGEDLQCKEYNTEGEKQLSAAESFSAFEPFLGGTWAAKEAIAGRLSWLTMGRRAAHQEHGQFSWW